MKTVPMIFWNQAIKSKLQYIWIHMGQLLTKFDVAKHPRFLSDRKIIKTEGFEVTTMQSSNLYRNMCDLRHTTARLQSLHWEAFKPNKKHSREIRQTNQFNYPLEFRTDDRWHLVQSQCFSIFAHHFDRSCTRLVTQQGALPKILPWWQWVRKQETAVPKLKILEKRVQHCWENLACFVKRLQKESNWKVTLRAFFRGYLDFGECTKLNQADCVVDTAWRLADVWSL